MNVKIGILLVICLALAGFLSCSMETAELAAADGSVVIDEFARGMCTIGLDWDITTEFIWPIHRQGESIQFDYKVTNTCRIPVYPRIDFGSKLVGVYSGFYPDNTGFYTVKLATPVVHGCYTILDAYLTTKDGRKIYDTDSQILIWIC